MSEKKTHWLHALSYALLTLALIALLSWLLYPRNNFTEDYTDPISSNKMLGERDYSLDILFAGDSICESAFSPAELWESSGYASYVLANKGQLATELPDFVDKSFGHQHFKLVILEADAIVSPKNSLSKYAFAKLKKYVTLLEHHNRWKTIGTDAFTLRRDFSGTDPERGYEYGEKVHPFTDVRDYRDRPPTEYSYVPSASKLSVKDIKNLCDENGAQLLIVAAPCLQWDLEQHNSTRAMADELGIPFLDMNGMDVVDWTCDAKDGSGHLNYQGMKKVCECLTEYLEANYDLPDHRGEAGYEAWENLPDHPEACSPAA